MRASSMATKHRKLFPSPSPINETTDCPDFCFPFSDFDYPPPSPPPLSISSSINHSHLDQTQQVSPYMIILISLLVSFFLLVTYYIIKSKPWLCFRSRINDPIFSRSDVSEDQEFHDDDHQNGVHHPIWLITTVGLHQSIINSITVCKYKKNEGLIEGTECSVCLSEFLEDETLRLLPKCSHAFHSRCIDTWLRSHTNCPLCRAHIMSSDRSVSCNILRPPLDLMDQNEETNHQMNSFELVDGEVGETENTEGLEEESEINRNSKEGMDDCYGDCVLGVSGGEVDEHDHDHDDEISLNTPVLMDSSSGTNLESNEREVNELDIV